MERRRFLASAAGVGATALGGCLDRLGGRGLVLDRLDVAGSPGGRVRVRPPDTVVLLEFWATWCPPCRPQMAALRTVHESAPARHMLSITTETDRDAIRSFWRDHDGRWSVAVDPELRATERFAVRRLPTLLVCAPDGEVVWRHVGLATADTIRGALERAER